MTKTQKSEMKKAISQINTVKATMQKLRAELIADDEWQYTGDIGAVIDNLNDLTSPNVGRVNGVLKDFESLTVEQLTKVLEIAAKV